MRQVPHYLLIGAGRVARHFQRYFSFLQLSFSTWNRRSSLTELQTQVKQASHILLMISDQAIEEFIIQHLQHSKAMHVHFSGSLISKYAFGAHPLSTFNHDLYDLAQYQAIPFILDHDAPTFNVLLPGLSNEHVRLHTSLKAKYHALCVLSGNFSCMLWQKFFGSLEQEFNIPPYIAYPYMRQQMQNLFSDPHSSLTGPLVRGDINTVQKNLDALHEDPFQSVYQSFVTCYQQIKQRG